MPKNPMLQSDRDREKLRPGKPARAPYGLRVIDGCSHCPVLTDRVFCNLPAPALRQLDAISAAASYPTGAVLFVEGQEPRGVFIICNGRVKLSGGSAKGKSLIFRIAGEGEIIGLPGTLSHKPYELTAEALEPTQANFIPRQEFLMLLAQHGPAALHVAQMLSEMYHAACQEMRYLGLSRTAAEKMARFLLDLTAGEAIAGMPEAKLTLTHEEIGEVIGASRETVTRLFASFKSKQYIDVRGASVVIKDQAALQELLGL